MTLLKDEHRLIARRIGAVERQIGSAGQGSGRNLRGSLSGLGTLLKTHFAHEEMTLYKPLDARLRGSSPTGELIEDHQSIRRAFDRLEGVCLDGEAPSADRVRRLSSLRSLLNRHLEKEEKVVFWLADCHLRTT